MAWGLPDYGKASVFNLGTTPDDQTGDPLYIAFVKINNALQQLLIAAGNPEVLTYVYPSLPHDAEATIYVQGLNLASGFTLEIGPSGSLTDVTSYCTLEDAQNITVVIPANTFAAGTYDVVYTNSQVVTLPNGYTFT